MSHPISRILYREDASRRPGDDHPSGRTIAGRLKQLPANSGEQPSNVRAHARCACFLPCSQWGLPSHGSHLPCWCALNAPFHPYQENPGGLLSVALARRSPWVAVSNHCALWSPDFPRPNACTPNTPMHAAAIAWMAHSRGLAYPVQSRYRKILHCAIFRRRLSPRDVKSLGLPSPRPRQ